MKLILVRHGNTFAKDDKVVWVGARSDLPLVEKGKEQAQAVGMALKESGIKADALYCGPLKRTVQTAEIALKIAGCDGVKMRVSDALREIDYGLWEARSNDDIRAEFGDNDIDGWQQKSIWPDGYEWSPDPEIILSSWNAMVAEIAETFGEDATAIIVTSNGILRIVAPQFGIAANEAKVSTGSLCLVEDGVVKIWNTKSL
ncbi:histidine phosphatase family protein [uncultured Cohaesibacter sp.]|uniref:histidine phosphatase family protein n=1 Tax=uncultured Cohaesibacter sp. TaxID=1002546 RepID=UPI002AA873C0|nr:histidine phosphatase family protein [uncultured Cohaesibacter sp.]